jgi:hypothetical protein
MPPRRGRATILQALPEIFCPVPVSLIETGFIWLAPDIF